MQPHRNTADGAPVRPAPRVAIPTAAEAMAARARLRDARRDRDDAAIAACLAVIEAHETGRPLTLRAAANLYADAR